MDSKKEKKEMYIVPIKLLMGLSITVDSKLKNEDLQKEINKKVGKIINSFIPDENIKKIMYDLSVAFSDKMEEGSGIMVPATYRAVNNEEDANIVSEFMKSLNENINKEIEKAADDE